MERFDREVPEPARLAVYGEIAAGRNAYVAPAAPSEIKHFAATPAGAALVAEWDTSASENVAMLRARAKRKIVAAVAASRWSSQNQNSCASSSSKASLMRKMAG